MDTAVWTLWGVALPIAYLLGTFPSAHLIARAHGLDITTVGSGNPGASNVTRALGWRAGVWVFVLDAAKGAISAGAGLALWGRPAGYLLGAAAVLGHIAPITRRFRGGKGVASGGGVILVLHPLVGAAVISLWWLVTRVSRTPAVGSIVAVPAAGVGLAITGRPAWELAAAAGLCLLILSRHLGNVRRLLRREEHAMGSARGSQHRSDPTPGPGPTPAPVGHPGRRRARIVADAPARTARSRSAHRPQPGDVRPTRDEPR